MGKNKGGQNGFYFFMVDLKSKQGYHSRSMAEMAQVAGPLWANMSAEQRKPYDMRAKQAKQGKKYTSQGIEIAEIERQERQQRDREEAMRQDIKNMVQQLQHCNKLGQHFFYIIHINNFCYANSFQRNYPAEIAVSRFNLENGVFIDQVFHRIIKPGPLPLGYSFEAKQTSDETHKIPPPMDKDAENNTSEVFNSLITFLMEEPSELHPFPPVFTSDKNIELISSVLTMFCEDFGEREDAFKVYSIEFLLFMLVNACAKEKVWPFLSVSVEEFEKDIYDYTTGIACEYHTMTDVSLHCSKSIVIRQVYVICENCCGYLGIPVIPKQHIPKLTKSNILGANTACSSYASSDYEDARTTTSSRAMSDFDVESVRSESVYSLDLDFPSLPDSRGPGCSRQDSDDGWQSVGSSRSRPVSNASRGRGVRPIELPSALAQRVGNMSLGGGRGRGRGRNIAKQPGTE